MKTNKKGNKTPRTMETCVPLLLVRKVTSNPFPGESALFPPSSFAPPRLATFKGFWLYVALPLLSQTSRPLSRA